MEVQKQKPKKKIDHLINWYFGDYCAKCGRIDLEEEDFGKKCLRKLQKIKESLNINEMTHKEFINIIKHSSFCHPFSRKFDECEVCKKFKINNKYWIKNWDGWNLGKQMVLIFLSFLVLQFLISIE